MANPVPNFKKHSDLGGRYNATEAVIRGAAQCGLPYQWGGVGNPSFDCSGFASWCYFGKRMFTSGMSDTALKDYKFKHRSYSKPEKGDIVYYSGSPGHVGIYTGDEWKHFYPNGSHGTGSVLQSSAGVGFQGGSKWTDIQHPKEGYGVYIDWIK